MPVEDHEVHEKVRISADEPYGCANRKELSGGYWVKVRVYIDGSQGQYELLDKYIPFRMSTKCRSFYLWEEDPRCGYCTSPKDYEYADKMRNLE